MPDNVVELIFNNTVTSRDGDSMVRGDLFVNFTRGEIQGSVTVSVASNFGSTQTIAYGFSSPGIRQGLNLTSDGNSYVITGYRSGIGGYYETLELKFSGTSPTYFDSIYTVNHSPTDPDAPRQAVNAPVTTNFPGTLAVSGLDSSGNAHGAKPLTATITDRDGTPVPATYTFSEGGTVVQTGSSNSYTPSYDESGRALSVSASYTDGKGRSSTVSASAGIVQGGGEPLQVSDFLNKAASDTLNGLKDFDGNHLGAVGAWKALGQVDIQGDGDREYVLVNQELGRWATLGADPRGTIDLASHGENGDTRVVGVYIDPLIVTGVVQSGSDFDSQRRLENDLRIDNIDLILGAGDYDKNGLQEVYFGLKDHSAVLHAYMHADGNIQYANYQNGDQMRDYLASNGFQTEWVL